MYIKVTDSGMLFQVTRGTKVRFWYHWVCVKQYQKHWNVELTERNYEWKDWMILKSYL